MVDRTSPEYQAHLEKIAGFAQILNNRCDQITEEIRAVEADINRTNIGIDVSSTTSFQTESIHADDATITRKLCLAYAKLDQWCIVVREFHTRDGQGELVTELKNEQPLTNASRALRLAAHRFLPDLVATIAEEAEQRAKDL